jgi:hypothetical protein
MLISAWNYVYIMLCFNTGIVQYYGVSPEAQAVLHVLATTSGVRVAPLLRRLVPRNHKLYRAKIIHMLLCRVGVLESVDFDFLLPDEDVEKLHTHGMQVRCCGHIHAVGISKKKTIV